MTRQPRYPSDLTDGEWGAGRAVAEGGHQVLADLLCHLDEFIHCRDMNIASLFTSYLEQRGHPAWQADAIINELCFTATRYRRLADYQAGLRPPRTHRRRPGSRR